MIEPMSRERLALFRRAIAGGYASPVEVELMAEIERLRDEVKNAKRAQAALGLGIEHEVFDYRPTEDDRREQQAQAQQDAS